MASARPRAVDRFRAKIDTSVASAISRRIASEPTIANPPTTTGSAAASRPPKTHTSTAKLTRDRDRLHHQHVTLGLGVDLREHHRRPARQHGHIAVFAQHRLRHRVRREPAPARRLFLTSGDPRDDQTRPAVDC